MVNIAQELNSLGLDQMWDELIFDVKSADKILRREYIWHGKNHNILAKLSNSNKSILYQHLIDNECLQYYLTKPRNHIHVFKGYITMFRISAHKLFIEIIDYVHVAVVMILKMSITLFLYARVI